MQWLGVDKDLKKLVVETTANQVLSKDHSETNFGLNFIMLPVVFSFWV